MKKILDSDGARYLWEKIKGYVAEYVAEHSGGETLQIESITNAEIDAIVAEA